MGFTDVYDYVNGKVEWMLAGLPLEGTGPHHAMAGEVATTDGLHRCGLGTSVGDSSRAITQSGDAFCLVLNDEGVVLGRLRKKHLDETSDVAVETVMETGPTTVRPDESAKQLLERMDKRKVEAVVVTTEKGVLLGIARRKDLRRLVEDSE